MRELITPHMTTQEQNYNNHDNSSLHSTQMYFFEIICFLKDIFLSKLDLTADIFPSFKLTDNQIYLPAQ